MALADQSGRPAVPDRLEQLVCATDVQRRGVLIGEAGAGQVLSCGAGADRDRRHTESPIGRQDPLAQIPRQLQIWKSTAMRGRSAEAGSSGRTSCSAESIATARPVATTAAGRRVVTQKPGGTKPRRDQLAQVGALPPPRSMASRSSASSGITVGLREHAGCAGPSCPALSRWPSSTEHTLRRNASSPRARFPGMLVDQNRRDHGRRRPGGHRATTLTQRDRLTAQRRPCTYLARPGRPRRHRGRSPTYPPRPGCPVVSGPSTAGR